MYRKWIVRQLTCQASISPFYTVDSTRWRLGWDKSRLAPDIDEEIRRSYFRFGCPRLSKPKAFPAPVFVDEFDPGSLQSGSDCFDSSQGN